MASPHSSSAGGGLVDLPRALDRFLWTRILVHLTLPELAQCKQVCSAWYDLARDDVYRNLTHLNLSLYWEVLGDVPSIHPLLDVIKRCESVRRLTLAYCTRVNEQVAQSIFESIPDRGFVLHIDLFYCHLITDETIRLVLQSFPNLRSLNVGACYDLTDKAAQYISRYGQNLRRLWIRDNRKMSNDVLIDLDALFNLKFLDIQGTTLDSQLVEEARATNPNRIMFGPEEVHNLVAGTRPFRKRRGSEG